MVTCDACINRLDELDRDNQRAADVYEVGNHAKDQMGHAMFFASDGRTALCIAKKRPA
jgi:hypothetical protein